MKNLPLKPDLDHLKGQAKSLLQSWKDQNPADPRKLADAQHALAQEYGFTKWADLKQRVEAILDLHLPPNQWVGKAMVTNLATPPSQELLDASIWVALCACDLPRIQKALQNDPAFYKTKGGPLQTEPLLYVCCSNLKTQDTVAAARLLLEAGADPNATYEHPHWKGYPLPALYGACGIKHDAELAELLIQHGANVNDNESLYHSTESPNTDCLRVLLKHNAETKNTNALKRALDYNRIEPVKILLEHGADPNEETQNENVLHHALRRRRPLSFIKLLVEHGATFEGTTREGHDILTHARLRSTPDIVEFLESKGATTQSDPLNDFVAAVVQNDLKTADGLLAQDPELPQKLNPNHLTLLPEAGWEGHLAQVERFLNYGWPVDAQENNFEVTEHNGPTALHTASFNGHPKVVEYLLSKGATLDLIESVHGSTPLGWALWARAYGQTPISADHPACVKLLLDAGAKLPEHYTSLGEDIDDLIFEAKATREKDADAPPKTE